MSPRAFLSRWYEDAYAENAYGPGAGRVQGWMHRSLERGLRPTNTFGRVLELGGNVGEHLEFVNHAFDEYILTDLYDSLSDGQKSALLGRAVRFETADVQRLRFEDNTFDRVVMTCVLHHVSDPERALSEMRRVTVPGGQIDILLSSDPGMIFRFARWVGPYQAARRVGLGEVKRLVDARDHLNHVGGLRRLARHVFRHDDLVERTYPVPHMTWNSSLWHTLRITRA